MPMVERDPSFGETAMTPLSQASGAAGLGEAY